MCNLKWKWWKVNNIPLAYNMNINTVKPLTRPLVTVKF